MSHFAHTRAGGVWNSNQVVFATEFADIDAKTFKALNGDEGGTWAPSSLITIGGAGLTVTGPFEAQGIAAFASPITVGDTAIFNSTVEFSAPVTFDGTTAYGGVATFNAGFVSNANSSFAGSGVHLTFGTGTVLSLASGSSLVCSAGALFNATVTCASTLAVTGAATMASTLVVTGAITSDGANFNGTAAVNINTSGGCFVSCPITCSGTARVIKRVTALSGIGADSSAWGPVNSDVVYVGSMTADATFTINGGVDGDEIRFVNKSPSHALTVSDPSTGIQVTLKNTTGQTWSALLVRFGGSFSTVSSDNF